MGQWFTKEVGTHSAKTKRLIKNRNLKRRDFIQFLLQVLFA